MKKKNFRKRSEISVSRTQKSDPLTRSKIEDFDAILAYLAYLAEDFGTGRKVGPSGNTFVLSAHRLPPAPNVTREHYGSWIHRLRGRNVAPVLFVVCWQNLCFSRRRKSPND